MVSDMNEEAGGRHGEPADAAVSRRHWLADCTVAAATALALLRTVPAARAAAQVPVILVVGDSLSAEYGLKRGTGWVALLSKRLPQRQIAGVVVNASISGDTTSGGRSRLAALLTQHHPDIVIIELGGNDALRGLPLTVTRENLDAMAKSAKESGAQVVVVGMQVPPNYGRRYGDQFAALFASVAEAQHAQLVPFLLRGVADAPKSDGLFQADRIHPTAAAQPIMLDNVWEVLAPLLLHRPSAVRR
jgi:acyl-CoA thioesterase-1